MSLQTQPVEDDDQNQETMTDDTRQAWGRLVPITQHKNATTFELFEEVTTFGRAGSCDYVLEDPGVSGRHCVIKRVITDVGTKSNDYVVWVEDHSTNGTYTNQEVIGKGNKRLMENGTTLHFLFKGKGKVSNISFIFQDCRRDEVEQQEEGGPHTQYHVRQILGSGSFAVVRLVIHKETGESYAMKIIDKKKFLMSNATKRSNALMDEVEILTKVRHPNIISIKEVFETVTTLYLILELVTGGELLDKIIDQKKFPEPQAKKYFKQMLEATQYLHQQGIAHRDLKPENILLKDSTSDILKLSDFGLSRVVDQTSFMKTVCGTPQYVAPEILTSSGYGLACDLWSCGVILYIMLCGYPPFNESKPTSIFEQIKTADFSFPDKFWSHISESAKDLIRRLLTIDPKKRITVQEALDSPWLKGDSTTTEQSDQSDQSETVSVPLDNSSDKKRKRCPPEEKNNNKKSKK